MLKKPIHDLFQLENRKMRFSVFSISNNLRLLEMAALPCAANRSQKNGVFQRPVNQSRNLNA